MAYSRQGSLRKRHYIRPLSLQKALKSCGQHFEGTRLLHMSLSYIPLTGAASWQCWYSVNASVAACTVLSEVRHTSHKEGPPLASAASRTRFKASKSLKTPNGMY